MDPGQRLLLEVTREATRLNVLAREIFEANGSRPSSATLSTVSKDHAR